MGKSTAGNNNIRSFANNRSNGRSAEKKATTSLKTKESESHFIDLQIPAVDENSKTSTLSN